jgi:SAM-dependent methyltransferase
MSVPLSLDAAWRRLHRAATAPYRKAGNFAWHFARGKLGHDPVFRGLVERGLIGEDRHRVVDIGCGQGLFASLLSAMGTMQSRLGQWLASWPATPAVTNYTGIELMSRDVVRAESSIGHLGSAPRFVCADMRTAALPPCDLVVILDVLHCVDFEAQEGVLGRVHAAMQPGGRLLLRVGDAASRRGFAISQWVDRTVTRIRGHRVSPTWGGPLADWTVLLQRHGFSVHSIPMSKGTPFANVLLVADLKES